jgi:hypothetical protein
MTGLEAGGFAEARPLHAPSERGFLLEQEQSCSFDVDGGVVVAVQLCATRTGMPAFVKAFLDDGPTAATHLAGVPGRDKQHAGTGPCCLAHDDLLELPPTSVSHRFVPASFRAGSIREILPSFILLRLRAPAHIGRLKLLKHDDSIGIDQLTRFFVMKVAPLIADLSVVFPDELRGLSPALRSALFARQCLLQSLELLFSFPQMTRVLDG